MAHSLEIRLPFLNRNYVDSGHLNPRTRDPQGQRQMDRTPGGRTKCCRRRSWTVEEPVFLPDGVTFEHPQINRLIERTLNDDQCHYAGISNPNTLRALVQRMRRANWSCSAGHVAW